MRSACQMRPAEAEGAGVVVALDPDPGPAGHQGREMGRGHVIERAGRCGVVETVAEADDDLRRGRGDVSRQPQKRVDPLVGREHRAAAPCRAFGLAQMQVRHGQKPLRRPEKRA
jgi:hypothetical protein